jgi:hypothetical protein
MEGYLKANGGAEPGGPNATWWIFGILVNSLPDSENARFSRMPEANPTRCNAGKRDQIRDKITMQINPRGQAKPRWLSYEMATIFLTHERWTR